MLNGYKETLTSPPPCLLPPSLFSMVGTARWSLKCCVCDYDLIKLNQKSLGTRHKGMSCDVHMASGEKQKCQVWFAAGKRKVLSTHVGNGVELCIFSAGGTSPAF